VIDILMFMTGMLELYGEEGTIYVTISKKQIKTKLKTKLKKLKKLKKQN